MKLRRCRLKDPTVSLNRNGGAVKEFMAFHGIVSYVVSRDAISGCLMFHAIYRRE